MRVRLPNEPVPDTTVALPCWYVLAHPDLEIRDQHTSFTKSVWKWAQRQLHEADYFDFIVHQKHFLLKQLKSPINVKWYFSVSCISCFWWCSSRHQHVDNVYISLSRPYLSSGVEIVHGTFLRLLFVRAWLCTGGSYMLHNVPLSAVIPLMLGEPLMWRCWRAGKNWVAVRRQQAAQDWTPTPLTCTHTHTHKALSCV